MSGELFKPDEWKVQAHDADHLAVTLACDSGQSLTAILPRATIPGLIERLVGEIGPGQGAAISRLSLRPGLTIQVQGFGGRRHPDGSADLAIFARLPDEGREVTIPLELTAQDVVELIAMLNGEG
jgi:hypothetical protein